MFINLRFSKCNLTEHVQVVKILRYEIISTVVQKKINWIILLGYIFVCTYDLDNIETFPGDRLVQ